MPGQGRNHALIKWPRLSGRNRHRLRKLRHHTRRTGGLHNVHRIHSGRDLGFEDGVFFFLRYGRADAGNDALLHALFGLRRWGDEKDVGEGGVERHQARIFRPGFNPTLVRFKPVQGPPKGHH